MNGDPETIRTSDLQIRNLPLYPAELRGHDDFMRAFKHLEIRDAMSF